MRKSYILDYSMLERLTKRPDFDNIIIGTGRMARDLRDKLRLLGLNVPFMIGSKADYDNGVRHYKDIASLEESKHYRFILCCDLDEWNLIAPARMAAYKFLGNAVLNHPQVIPFNAPEVVIEAAGEWITDCGACNSYLRDDFPYAVYGDKEDDRAFKIHILGSCHASGIFNYAQNTYPELLHNKLDEYGFKNTVYSWAQPLNPVSDIIFRFVRDVSFHEIDLLIVSSDIVDLNPMNILTRNLLYTRTGAVIAKPRFIWQLQGSYHDNISSGIDHDISLIEIRKTQQKVLNAFTKMYNLTMWNVFFPMPFLLSEEQCKYFRGVSSGHVLMQKKRMDELLSVVKNQIVKNYTDAFIDADDIFTMFSDPTHFSEQGYDLLAKLCAADILNEFQK